MAARHLPLPSLPFCVSTTTSAPTISWALRTSPGLCGKTMGRGDEGIAPYRNAGRPRPAGCPPAAAVYPGMNRESGGEHMKIIVDAMGGDNAPVSNVRGALAAVRELGVEVILVGRGEDILKVLKEDGIGELPPGLEIVHASEVVEMCDNPATAFKEKKDSSLTVGLNLLKNGAYFHDKKVDIFCFEKNRFKFYNSFQADHAKDALYFILFVWKQLGLQQMQDELHVSGDIPDKDWFLYNAKLYVKKTFLLNPSAEFNRAPITEIKGMPFDLLTLYLSK